MILFNSLHFCFTLKRNSRTGGAAYGMPQKVKYGSPMTDIKLRPCINPWLVCTIASYSLLTKQKQYSIIVTSKIYSF